MIEKAYTLERYYDVPQALIKEDGTPVGVRHEVVCVDAEYAAEVLSDLEELKVVDVILVEKPELQPNGPARVVQGLRNPLQLVLAQIAHL